MAVPKSLYDDAWHQAVRHKYLESQKAGCDRGLDAIDEWHQHYWTLYLRHRWLEHLTGEECYEEFSPESHGALRRRFGDEPLVQVIADRVRLGAENIDVLLWAAEADADLDTVIAILTEMRVNDIRCTRFCVPFAEDER
jgi:hypothetical protein